MSKKKKIVDPVTLTESEVPVSAPVVAPEAPKGEFRIVQLANKQLRVDFHSPGEQPGRGPFFKHRADAEAFITAQLAKAK